MRALKLSAIANDDDQEYTQAQTTDEITGELNRLREMLKSMLLDLENAKVAKEEIKRLKKEIKERRDLAYRRLELAIEESVDVKNPNVAREQLYRIQAAWQEKEEAFAENIEQRKLARETLSMVETRLGDTIKNARQLKLEL